MSQIGTITRGGGGGGEVFTLTGTTGGGPVSPDGLGNITLQAGAGLTITGEPGFNRLVLVNTDSRSSLTWTVDPGPGPTTLVAGTGYFANNAGTITYPLPTVAAVGDTFAVVAMNNDNSWVITVGAGQTFQFGNMAAVVSVSSQAIGNSVTFVCNVANTDFMVIASQGNPDVI